MGDIDIDIDVKKWERVQPALRSGLSEGLEEAGEWLMDKGESHARDIVMFSDRIWNKQVKRGFTTDSDELTNRYYRWTGEIRNNAPHAMIVEKGLAPAGEITGSSPSVQDIIPWVDDEVVPNAEAQESAEKANIGNWNVQLQALAVEYGKATVIAAFAIAESLKEDGYPGIRFMGQTESYLQSQTMNVKNKVEKQMERELRAAGLK